MIWIQTETPIGRVFFGYDEPNEIFMEGDVWIYTGDVSNVAFNSLKIGNSYMDMVYPLAAKQYVDGVWNDVEVMSYQIGEWVNWWNGRLFYNGNQYDSITGGLKTVHTAATKVTFNDENFIFAEDSGNDGNGYNAAVYTNNKIDVTNFKMLTVEVKDVSSISTSYSAWGVYIGLSNNNTSYNPIGNNHTITNKKYNTIGAAVISLDITNIEGFYYPVIYCDVTKCTVNKWYLS